jgi:PKD repeat protein
LISTKGNWKYWVDVTHNTTGCKNSDSIWANLQSNPSIDLGPDINSCGPSEVLKNNLTNTGTYNYVWNTTATTPTLTVSLPGTYRMTMTDALFGCSSTDSVKVLFNALPVFNLGNDIEVCQDSFVLTAPLTGANYTYKWTGGATTSSLNVKNTGDYCLTISNGCLTYTDCIRVNLMKNANMYFDSLPDFKVGCNQATLIATSNLSNNRIRWSTGATTNSIIVNQSGSYSASISGVCGNLTKSVRVQIDKSPSAAFNIQFPNVDDSLTILCVNLSSVGANYYWEFGDTKTSTDFNAVHTYSNEGSYLVTLRVKNACGEKSFSQPTGILRKKTIGIIENLKDLNLNLYPNPANATTKLFASGMQNGKYNISMSNILGQIVYTQEVDIKNNLLDININVKSIAAGEYLINLFNDNQSIIKKLIVIK